MESYFVTGTDTEIGKTLIACALLRTLAKQGKRVVGMKPVAAGCQEIAGAWTNEDVEALRLASTHRAPPELVNPYLFRQPIAPHIAASEEDVVIDIEHIVRCFKSLQSAADAVVVEGVGGFRVPFSASYDSADLAAALKLPVILVVGMRLGCLNHALLTYEAIAARRLKFAGWVANRVDPQMAKFAENVEALRERLPAPLLATVPFMAAPNPDKVELDWQPLQKGA